MIQVIVAALACGAFFAVFGVYYRHRSCSGNCGSCTRGCELADDLHEHR